MNHGRRFARAFRHLQRRLLYGQHLSRLSRQDYRRVWNSLASNEDQAKLYVAGYTNEEELLATAHQFRATLEALVGLSPSDTVLEIGAGIGRLGQVIAPVCREWIGTDVSRNMLSHANRRLTGVANARTQLVSGFDLSPISSASIDLVYSTVVFMHLDDWDRYQYISEGYRVLKEGGRMLVDNVNLLSNDGWRFFVETNQPYRNSPRPPHISKMSTPEELETYFVRAGFERVQQFTSGMWLTTYGWKPASAHIDVK